MGGQVRPRWEGELGGTQDKEPCDIARQGDSRSEGPRCRAAGRPVRAELGTAGDAGQGPGCEDLAGGGGSGALLRGKLRVIEGFRADAGKDPADVSKESLQPLCSE